MADAIEVRILVTYIPTSDYWESKIFRLTEEEFDELKDEISLFTQGVQLNLSFEDPNGSLQYFSAAMLPHIVTTLVR